jgi:hypothetical protein
MTDDLKVRLFRRPCRTHLDEETIAALEAKDRRIADLEAQLSQDVLFENCEYRSEAGWDRLRARIAELEAENKRLGILHENYKAAVARAAYLGEKK